MHNSIVLEVLKKYLKIRFPNSSKSYLLTSRSQSVRLSQSTAGFTMIELIGVVVMIGILGAIAAPGWLGFVNRQKVNKANDAVLAVVQEAQRQAKSQKREYSVSFRNDATNGVQVALNPGDTPSNWQTLGADVGLKSKEIWIGTNITTKNKSAIAVNPITTTATDVKTISFGYNGTLPINATEGLKIVVAIPQSGDPTLASSNTKRCVIIETLIGGIRTAKTDSDCS